MPLLRQHRRIVLENHAGSCYSYNQLPILIIRDKEMSAETVVETTDVQTAPAAAAGDATVAKGKKKKKETYRVMQYLLKVGKIESKQDTFPSDQFILKNLPDAIRKTDGASKKAKIILGLAAATLVLGLGGIIAPLVLGLTGVIGTATAMVGGAISLSLGVAAGMVAQDQAQDFGKEFGEGLGKRLLAKHLVEKGRELNAQRKANAEQRRKERAAEKAAKKASDAQNDSKPAAEQGAASKLFSGALKLKKAWDDNAPKDTKDKATEGIKNAGDAAKKKIGSLYDRIKNRGKKKGNDKAA